MTTTELAEVCRKRSFLRLRVNIDLGRLQEEFARIPESAWGMSHWDNHCSIDVLQLRGGGKGEPLDYVCEEIVDSPVLRSLPYIASLIDPTGPFGSVSYAVIFRTKPFGMSRIHVPVTTNPGAVLLVEGRSQHLGAGEVWTFDNQAKHSVMNGDTARAHLILDVPPNPRLAALMQEGEFTPGTADPERWETTCKQPETYAFARGEPLSRKEKEHLGLVADGFAGRVTAMAKRARLFGYSPLRVGDIVVSVDGVTKSHLSRSAIDYMFRNARAGATVAVEGLRRGAIFKTEFKLFPAGYFDAKARFRQLVALIHGASSMNRGD